MCSCVYSEFYNNYQGLSVFQYNEENAKVMIEDVTANNNELVGLYLTGTGITVNNAISRNNQNGIYLTGTGITVNNANSRNNEYGLAIGNNIENEITLVGDIDATNNKYGFIAFSETQGKVYVAGNLNLNRNNVLGVATDSSPEFTLVVGGSYSGKSGKNGSGSLTACDNNLYDIGQYDIYNFGGSTFEGSDYTCGTKRVFTADVPNCKPCHPGCS